MDGHVHLHRLALVQDVLDAAARNFMRVTARQSGLLGALLLTQSSRERVFEALEQQGRAGTWALAGAAAEPETLIATAGACSIAIVCGRQVRVDNGIEVSGLGTRTQFEDGRTLQDTIAAVRGSGALMMIPWGLGKWSGRRGAMVETVMRETAVEHMYMGDSGCRLGWLPAPRLIRRARALRIGVLAGTDPFPFLGDHRRTGSFGFLADLEPSIATPWRTLREWLERATESPRLYGSPTGPVRFFANQLGIHAYNRLRARSS